MVTVCVIPGFTRVESNIGIMSAVATRGDAGRAVVGECTWKHPAFCLFDSGDEDFLLPEFLSPFGEFFFPFLGVVGLV